MFLPSGVGLDNPPSRFVEQIVNWNDRNTTDVQCDTQRHDEERLSRWINLVGGITSGLAWHHFLQKIIELKKI